MWAVVLPFSSTPCITDVKTLQVSLAGQIAKAPGGQEVKMLPMAEAGRPDALEAAAASAANEAGPSRPPPAVTQAQAQTPTNNRGAAAEAGMNRTQTTPTRTPVGSASSSSLRAAGLLDPNRAFQAINAETLEVASALADYPIPPVSTQVLLARCAVLHLGSSCCALMLGSFASAAHELPLQSYHQYATVVRCGCSLQTPVL